MRRPDQDVMLTNGQGYMVEEAGYGEYLNLAKEPHLVFFFAFISILTYECRGHLVGITELLMLPNQTIKDT